MEKAKQQKEFDAFQIAYNKLRTNYGALAKKEEAGTITTAEKVTMQGLVAEYEKNKAKFDLMEE